MRRILERELRRRPGVQDKDLDWIEPVITFGKEQGITDPRKLTVEDLGLSEDDLAQMDERQNTSDTFDFDDVTWNYRISREVRAWRVGQSQPNGSYYWEYRDGSGQLLAIRKEEAEPFSVNLYRAVNPQDVTVYRK